MAQRNYSYEKRQKELTKKKKKEEKRQRKLMKKLAAEVETEERQAPDEADHGSSQES